MPRLIRFHRHRYAASSVLYDEGLELRSVAELRKWAARNIAFVVLDSETGDDITHIILAASDLEAPEAPFAKPDQIMNG